MKPDANGRDDLVGVPVDDAHGVGTLVGDINPVVVRVNPDAPRVAPDSDGRYHLSGVGLASDVGRAIDNRNAPLAGEERVRVGHIDHVRAGVRSNRQRASAY